MCTVSFIASKDKVYLTSNRDEHQSRPKAFVPKESTINGTKVVYPKDPKAGGTWFALNEYGTVVVLLNGAFINHKSLDKYRKSRGLIVLDVIGSTAPLAALQSMDLDQIEPFTLILYADGLLHELRWDGNQKYLKRLTTEAPHIWSSATLYSTEAVATRERAFNDFISGKNTIPAADIIGFHSQKTKDQENGFIIDRNTGLKTFSVTQAKIEENGISLHHKDLINATDSFNHLDVHPKICTSE